MRVAIIDYGSGNLRSAAKAFERAADAFRQAIEIQVTADPDAARSADRIVLPGVGAFGDCIGGLSALPGMVDALRESAIDRGRPFMGICVGMQLTATVGREHGEHAGLGWIPGAVEALRPANPALKVPHMGWNDIRVCSRHPVLAGLDQGESGGGAHVYFVHSYGFRPDDPAHVLAMVDYGGDVAAIVGRDNLIGTQFHPEKSQSIGLGLIAAFLKWSP